MRRSARWVIGSFYVLLVAGVGCDSGDTTTTQPPIFKVDGKQYREKHTCNITRTGQPPTCAELNAIDRILFTLVGGSLYEAREVPDTGFLYTGTITGTVFDWTATSPNGYHESGVWTFDGEGNSFTGSSTYTADDGSYTGECNTNGVALPQLPDSPPLVSACP